MSWRTRDSLRSRAGDLVVDAAIACEHVYWTMASRAFRRLVHPARRGLSHRWPSSWGRVATPRPASSPTIGIVRPTPAWTGVLPLIEDYIFPRLTAFKTAVLVDRTVDGLRGGRPVPGRLAGSRSLEAGECNTSGGCSRPNRKEAAVVNREFLDWLSRRRQPERPFFAFLNFYDAHIPTSCRRRASTGSASRPTTLEKSTLLEDWLPMTRTGFPRSRSISVATAYDDCVADLDEQLGRLIDELDRRAVLERTWVIIAADHGESFGEHPGVFCHGTSLYQTQLHVPLVIIPPAGARRRGSSPRR